MFTKPLTPSPWYRLAWRYARGCIIFLVVVFHLLFLAIRNPLDLWYRGICDWMKHVPVGELLESEEDPLPPTWWDRYGDEFELTDRFTFRYANLFGVEQGWCMFQPPVAREAYFLGARVEFRDGSSSLLLSDNAPIDPTRYFRLGGWQTRKHEDDCLYYANELSTDFHSLSKWSGYARHLVRKWKATHPDDPREVERLVFVRRRIGFPEPGQRYEEPATRHVADMSAFDAEGRLLP